ncbi:hypothetical protein ATN84_20100 [Paramesorhizobium deserti]|uniref:Uncharacterized protein n=1 Tax=Paramesorhizobium deserti TaxID=1494590 RepID=A0A135HPD4_9HYPH|nr:hypothetical protein [Paramesorhizobium deserti]KXF74996.1 hypothetical protein ATN84_20100 [Paramesorhizobium deserti]
MAKDPKKPRSDGQTDKHSSKPTQPDTGAPVGQDAPDRSPRKTQVSGSHGAAAGEKAGTTIQFVSPSNNSQFNMYSQVKIQAKCDDPNVEAIVWSFVNNYFGGYNTPNLMYVIEPLRSTRSPNGLFETTLTYFGPNPSSGYYGYYTNSFHALADDPSLGIPPAKLDLRFNSASPPAGNIFALDLRAAYTILTDGSVHPLLASFTDYAGNLAQDSNWNGTITWSVDFDGSPPSGATVQLLTTDPTKVDDGGFAANGIRVVSSQPVYIKITATATGTNPVFSRQATVFCTSATLPGQGSMAVTSDETQPLTLDQLHGITSTYTAGYGGLNSRTMEWRPFPSDRLSFSKGPWSLIAGNGPGIATNSVEANGTTPIPKAMIFTSGFNDQTRVYDWGVLYPLQFGEEPSHGIEISGPDPIPMYTPVQLTATNQNTSDQMSSMYWWGFASDPGYQFVFSPKNPTDVTGNLSSTVTVTIYGPQPEPDMTITIYAQSDNPDVPIGQKDFGLKEEAAPSGNVLAIQSLDGNPLSENTPHLLQATYQTADGSQKHGNQPVDWTLLSGTTSGVKLNPTQTTTLSDGTTVTSVEYDGSGSAVAYIQAKAGTKPDIGTLTIQFSAKTDPVPGLGSMQLQSTDGNDLTAGVPHQLTCTYKDSKGQYMPAFTPVIWNGIPDDRLTFSGGSNPLQGDASNVSRVQGDKGEASIYVTAAAGVDFTALISTIGVLNPEVGTNDHADTPLTPNFKGGLIITSPDGASLPLYLPSHPSL